MKAWRSSKSEMLETATFQKPTWKILSKSSNNSIHVSPLATRKTNRTQTDFLQINFSCSVLSINTKEEKRPRPNLPSDL